MPPERCTVRTGRHSRPYWLPEVEISADEKFLDALVPPGEHSGKGFQDPAYPITGR
jgi:hypothetical protein